MARLDRVKNLTGLAEMYAKNDRLRASCNLVVVGGIVDPSQVRSSNKNLGIGGLRVRRLTGGCNFV